MTKLNKEAVAPGGNVRIAVLAIVFAIVLIAIGSVVGFSTGPGTDGWYAGLIKSPLNPPGWLFGVVWPILYACIGVSTALLWARRNEPLAKSALILMGIQLVLNYFWSFIFFEMQLVQLAFWWILAIAICVAVLVPIAMRTSKIAGLLLVPYFAWLCFAAYLSGTIFFLN